LYDEEEAKGALKKSWRQLKHNLSIGEYHRVEELKARISYIRSAMGLLRENLVILFIFTHNKVIEFRTKFDNMRR
jgi:DNA repair protein RadC